MPQTSIPVELSAEVQARLISLAVESRRSVCDVAAEIISLYFAPDSWEAEPLPAAIADLESNLGTSEVRPMEWPESHAVENELGEGKTRLI